MENERMQRVETIDALREARNQLAGRVGLVATMGALHTGHISLVEQARAETDAVVATIFINPTQFAAGEDFDTYPRDLHGDLEKLRQAGVDLVFTPERGLIYPPGYQSYVTVEEITQRLEGERRPGHFRGVATVVAKLFNLARPDAACFGQKDAQQVAVIRRMAADLNFPLEIIVCPTLRESDGLAMSSRNVYLNERERAAAGSLFRALSTAGDQYEQGERDPAVLREILLDVFPNEPLVEIEYAEVVDPCTFQPVETVREDPLLLVLAARIGRTRLIDNMLLPWALNTRDGLTATLGAIFANSL
jgi:pantoate--beta-alanine ligase